MNTPLGGRRVVTVATSLAVLAGSTLLAASSSSSASPGAPLAAAAEDCATAYPLDEIERDAPVTGLTVDRGTTPEGFSGEVIGVLDDGIAPGLDMILARLTSPEIDRVGGIWSGMSGSPVYAEDGSLIGAVAYGLAYGSSPVAGITPYEDMDDYLGAEPAPRKVAIGRRVARTIAAETDVSVRQAAQGIQPLPMPLGVSGVSQRRLDQAAGSARQHPYIGSPARVVAGGGDTAVDADASSIVAGGNLAAAVAYGDISLAGTGTATSVCAGKVVGFGHPFSFAGPTTLSLHPADALYVQEESLGAPFKVANLGGPVGTITDDRLTGITGTFGRAPAATRITSGASFGDRTRTGTTKVNLDDYDATVTLYQMISNQERVADGWIAGSARQRWTIKGTNARGKRFSVRHGDRFTSSDITYTSAFDLADLVWAIADQRGVQISSVAVDSDLTTQRDRLRVAKVQQRRKGSWSTITGKSPGVVRAGGTLRLRVSLASAEGRAKRTRLALDVPRRARGKRVSLQVTGGNSAFSEAAYQSGLGKIIDAVRSQPRNDEVQAQLAFRSSGTKVTRQKMSRVQPLVVSGRRQLSVQVR